MFWFYIVILASLTSINRCEVDVKNVKFLLRNWKLLKCLYDLFNIPLSSIKFPRQAPMVTFYSKLVIMFFWGKPLAAFLVFECSLNLIFISCHTDLCKLHNINLKLCHMYTTYVTLFVFYVFLFSINLTESSHYLVICVVCCWLLVLCSKKPLICVVYLSKTLSNFNVILSRKIVNTFLFRAL